ncbi:expressed unknown protein [Seminavis robusta]|uniref:Uncharacterized protein n=1 Tax=Seminavis robusta TaxID=568900 RepID=A0A9N8HTM5_9STRA|nr:expressed unknown protein [Seminavis robusta]|eukprot:Sro1908_g304720.1 n/a (201) ;mRNA; r:3488-4090
MIITHTPPSSASFPELNDMKLLTTKDTLGENRFSHYGMASASKDLDASIGDLSYVSVGSDHSGLRDDSKKRVSWGPSVEIREYKVIQGDHPVCGLFPLSLDWEHSDSVSRDMDASPERRSSYQQPRKLSLDDRRRRLFGDVEENVQDFADLDADLDAMLAGLDDCLTETTMPTFSLPVPIPPPVLFTGDSCFDDDEPQDE